MRERECPKEMSVPRCINVVNKTSTVDLVYYTSDGRARQVYSTEYCARLRVVVECAKFITHCSLWPKIVDLIKKCCHDNALERSQPNFTAIIYALRAINPENWVTIGLVLYEIIGLEPIVKTGSSFGTSGHARLYICTYMYRDRATIVV